MPLNDFRKNKKYIIYNIYPNLYPNLLNGRQLSVVCLREEGGYDDCLSLHIIFSSHKSFGTINITYRGIL